MPDIVIDQPFVVDGSVTLAWCLPDESQAMTVSALRALAHAHVHASVPSIWWYELRNVLIANERRARITVESTSRFLARMTQLPIRIDHELREVKILELARHHQLSVYDAAYLDLAQRLNRSLATLDKALRNAARVEAVALIE